MQCCGNQGEEEKGQQVGSDAGPHKEVAVTLQEQVSGIVVS